MDRRETERLLGAIRQARAAGEPAGVVWLNPLLETEGYEPTASGMRAARPFVTTFTSVNDASGLARLSRMVRIRA